jgi:hypothetical protein
MKLTQETWFRTGRWFAVGILGLMFAWLACAQTVSTTTVQGTVYLANGLPASGTLQVSWPAFNPPGGAAVTAGKTTVTIGADGFFSVNLAPNQGSSPAGLFYTAIYHLSDGSTSTEYWVVPQAAQATLAQVRALVMPAAQAVQTVSKAYVDQAIQSLAQGSLSPVGGTLTGPLYLAGDPTLPLEAADKHYVDITFATAMPLSGGASTGMLTGLQLGAAWQVDQFVGSDFGAKLQACINGLSATYGGICDARNFAGALAMASNLTISRANATILLPCATISTANQIIVPAGTRNVSLRGCSLRGASAASGSQGGTVFQYSGSASMIQVGDPTYAVDTPGFHLDNAVVNVTSSSSGATVGFTAYRTQELDLESLYFLGNSNQTGMTIDGTGNYSGGTFYDNQFTGFQVAVNAVGHQTVNAATTDWLNASTFIRLHINCPTSSGNPISGTTGINLAQGDGNTIISGDVEGCATALHLGSNAQNNTIVGLRNENSTNQVVADAGSAYNSWITGGTIFTGRLTDNGTRNSFLDTFHRSFNGLNGDWYGSTRDATVTNHYRLGTGQGYERGLYDRYQTDYGYRWTTGLSDATSGAQFYQILDELNNVYRLSIGQYLSGNANTVTNVVVNNSGCYSSSTPPSVVFNGGGGMGAAATVTMMLSTSASCVSGYSVASVAMTAGGSGYTSQPTVIFTGSNQTTAPSAVAEITTAGSTNNQTVLNAAGTGAIVLNGSTNSGTGGVVFGSGGPSETTVATINSAGNAQFNGTLQVGGTSTFTGSTTVRNQADAEIDQVLWAGTTTNQKESFIYKDYTGASQWYMVKDANNNWALNSAPGGLDSFKAYQSTNSGDTYINTSNSSGVVRVNYENGSGAAFNIYGGNSSTLYASFLGANAIKFPGLAAISGHNCLQIDNSGYVTNTGAACGSATGGSGTVGSGTTGQIAYYSTAGNQVSGLSVVPVSSGGTGATSVAAALASLGGASLTTASAQTFSGPINVPAVNGSVNKVLLVTAPPYNAKCDGETDDHSAIQAAFDDALANGYTVQFPAGTCRTSTITMQGQSFFGAGMNETILMGMPGQDVFATPDSAVSLSENTYIHDLLVLVDSSVNAASSAVNGNNTFPNRITGTAGSTTPLPDPPVPGPIVFNSSVGCTASMTAGSTTVDFSCPMYFQNVPSYLLVGKPITLSGAGASGATLTTTVAAVNSQSQLTVATAAATTVATASGTVGNGIAAPWYIGNCGFAFPASDGANMPSLVNNWAFRNIRIMEHNTTVLNNNYTCGFFFQVPLNALHFEHILVQQLWAGIIEAPPAENTSSYFAWTPDESSYRDIDLGGNLLPMVWYNGTHRSVHGLNILGGVHPFTLGLFQINYDLGTSGVSASTATITQYYNECWNLNSGELARFSGIDIIHGGSLAQCGGSQYVNWKASNSTVDAQIGTALHISGNLNSFSHTSLVPSQVTDSGTENAIQSGNVGNDSWFERRFNAGPIPTQEPVGKLDAGFLVGGSSQSPFVSASDLMTTCRDYRVATVDGSSTPCVNDPSGPELSRSFMYSPGAGSLGTGYSTDLNFLFPLGGRIPLTSVYVITQGMCEGTSSCSANVTFSDLTASTSLGSCTLSFGAAWNMNGGPNSSNPCLLNLSTATAGHIFGWNTGSWSGSPTGVRLAMLAYEPVNTDVITETLNSARLQDVVQVRSAGNPVMLTAANWLWNGNLAGSTDATSPVGYSTALSNAYSLSSASGSTNLNGGFLYPAVPSTISYLVQAPTVLSNTLATSLAAADTSITVTTATTSAYAAGGCFQVDQEIICYAGTLAAGTTTFAVSRAQYGTLAQTHASGATLASVGTAGMSAGCNSTTNSSVNVVFGATWSYFQAPFSAQNCSGYATSIKISGANGPTGQTYKIAAIQIAQDSTIPQATAANQVPLSANAGSNQYPWTGTKTIAGNGAALTTGPSSSMSGNIVTFSGTAGQVQDSGTALSALATKAAPAFTGSATFSGNTTTFANNAVAEQDVVIQPGAGADQVGAFALSNYSGTVQWKLRKDASNYFRITDPVNSIDRAVFYQNGQTVLNAGNGANPMVINGTANSGTGGLLVQSGGSNPTTVLTVTGSGNTTATGFVAGKFLMGSGTTTLTAGSAAGTGSSITCATSHVCDGVSGTVTLTTGTGATTGTLATLGFPNTHTNQANCVVAALSSTGLLTSMTWSESTTALTLTANTALSNSTAYSIRYWCGGN